MTSQTIIYECGRKNSVKKVSNSEWYNVWNEGIKLERGDTVRLLGSFINEDGDAEDIQVLDGSSFTMEYIPYINADTVIFEDSAKGAGKHLANYQMKLGDIASPAYTTDAYGIEPPYWAFNQTPLTRTSRPDLGNAYRLPVSDRFSDYYGGSGWRAIWDADTSGPPKPNSGIAASKGYDYAFNDYAIKMGSYMDTSSLFPRAAVHLQGDAALPLVDDNRNKVGCLGNFNVQNVDQQFHIAHLCKLIFFPVFAGIYYEEDVAGNFSQKQFDVKDYLSVGDYISTYFISNYASTGNVLPTIDPGNTFGNVNWHGGPRSVVGKILAIKKVYHDVFCNIENEQRSMEFQAVYVYEFINPGSYKNQNTATGRPRHGSSFLENGYQPNRNDNRNAGATCTAVRPDSYPHKAAFLADNSDIQLVTDEVMDTSQSGLDKDSSPNLNMLYETNTSLSFLWSCRGTDTRSLVPDKDSADDGTKTQISSFITIQDNLFGPFPLSTIYESFPIGANAIKIVWDDTLSGDITLHSNVILPSGNRDIREVWYEKEQGYIELILTAPTADAGILGNPLTYNRNSGGIYWYPRQYQVKIEDFEAAVDANRKWKYERVHSNLYTYWGAIVRMNPNDDNNEPYVPDPLDPDVTHRLYIPFGQQTSNVMYRVKHFGGGDGLGITSDFKYEINAGAAHNHSEQPFGSPCTVGQVRRRQNFGVSTGRKSSGDSLTADAAHMPVPYNLTIPDGWSHYYTTKVNMLNQQSGNSYNDSVCSIHIQQPLSGSLQYDQCDINNPASMNADPFVTDLLYIKKFKVEIKPKPGYYGFSQVAEDINDQLHYNHQDYQRLVGSNTTVGLRERQPGVSPNVINGNFVHSYLPDITYGFLPITQQLYEANTAKFNERKIYTHRTNCIDEYFTTYNDRENNSSNSLVSSTNTSINIFTIPSNQTIAGVPIPEDNSLQLFRFNGAKLFHTTNTDSQDDQAPSLTYTNRFYDMLNTTTDTQGFGTAGMRRRTEGVCYQTRSATNNFTCGGCVKLFVGAVNPTFRIDTNINRMVWEYLYTPYRPASDDTGSALTLVSGEAVPSAIIDSHGNGGITDSLSGIYIRDLVSTQITDVYRPIDFLDFTYPTLDLQYVDKATTFWNSLGYTDTQLNSFRNNSGDLPFIFFDREFVMGSILHNISDLDTSVNASNPFYSYCSLWLPPLQFSVEVESDQEIANKQPLTVNTPFYLVGSDFPAQHYYGNKGTKLPVVGVCSRQFTSFGYAFDLSESSITWTIDEDITITSIHTKIYNNDMTVPLNLGEQSAIIYVVTKPNYYKQTSPEDMQENAQLALENTQPIKYSPDMFYYQGQMDFQAPLFYEEDETDDEEY